MEAMDIAQQLADFNAFAAHLAQQPGGENLSLAHVIDQWQSIDHGDVEAIRAALESYDAGERGRPYGDVLKDLRTRIGGD